MKTALFVASLAFFQCVYGFTDCQTLDSVEACAQFTNCTVVTNAGGDFVACSPENVCDVKLDYTQPNPYGCPQDVCKLEGNDSGLLVCTRTKFWDAIGALYLGTFSGVPVGFILMNFLLLFILGLLMYMIPKLSAWIICYYFNQSDEGQLSIQSVHVAPLGGKIYFSNLDYVSPNIHLQIAEGGVKIKWWVDFAHIFWRSESKIVTEKNMENRDSGKKSTMSTTPTAYRLSAFLTGVELSIFNNQDKYTELEKQLRRYFPARANEANEDVDLEFGGTDYDQIHSAPRRYFCCCFRRAKRNQSSVHHVDDDDENGDLNQKVKSRPWLYDVFPVSKLEFSKTCVYISDPFLASTAVFYAERGIGFHWLKSLQPGSSKFSDCRSCTEVTWSDAKLQFRKNKGRISFDDLRSLRNFSESAHCLKGVFNVIRQLCEKCWPYDHNDFVSEEAGDEFETGFFDDDDPEDEDDLIESDSDTSKRRSSITENTLELFKSLSRNLTNPISMRMQPSIPLVHSTDSLSSFSNMNQTRQSGGESMSSAALDDPEPQQTNKNVRTRPKSDPLSVQLQEPDILRTSELRCEYLYDYAADVEDDENESASMAWIEKCPKSEFRIDVGNLGSSTTITYGPWTDKQRAMFIDRFFPQDFSMVPEYRPQMGDTYESLELNILVTLFGETKIRIPYRIKDSSLYNGMSSELNPDFIVGNSSIWQTLTSLAAAQGSHDEMHSTSFGIVEEGFLDSKSRSSSLRESVIISNWLLDYKSGELGSVYLKWLDPVISYQTQLISVCTELFDKKANTNGFNNPELHARHLFQAFNGKEILLW